MLNFFISPTKRKDGKRLEFCGDSCVTIRCPAWQFILLLLICVSDLTVWAEEQTMPDSSPHLQYSHTEHLPQTPLRRLPFANKQRSGSPVLLWKEYSLKTLSGNIHRLSVNSNRQNKQNRLLKRELDNPSQNKSTSSSKWTWALNEIARQVLSGHVLSAWLPVIGRGSVVKNDISSSPSSFQVKTLRNLNADNDVVETKPNKSVSAPEIQVMSTQKYSISSMQQTMSSGHSINEEETKSEATLSSESSVTTLLYSSTQSSDRPHTEKPIYTTDWRGANFPVAHATQVLTRSGSNDIKSTSLPLSTNLSGDHTKPITTESSNYVSKTFSTREQCRQCVKVNDTSNTSLVMPVHTLFQTTTVNTVVTRSFEATSADVQIDSISVKSQASSSVIKPTVTSYNEVYSSDLSSSSAPKLLDSPHTLTSQKQEGGQLVSFASDVFSISALPSTRGTLEITSSNTDHDLADMHKMISTEGRIERSSLVMDSKSAKTLFDFDTVSHGSFTTPVTNLPMSDITATTEHESNSGAQTNPATPQAPSTWSSLKNIVTAEENNASSDMEYFQMDYKMPSDITSQPLTNLHMSDTAATIESEFNLDEQTYTAAAQDPSTWSALKTILTAEENNASSDLDYFQMDYKMFSNVSSQPFSNLHMSDSAATIKSELNSGEQINTAMTQTSSTWSYLEKSGSTVDSTVSTHVTHFEADYKMPSDITSQPLTNLHMSDTAATTESEFNLDEQTYTAAAQDPSTWSALKAILTTEENNASSDLDYFQMDYKMFSNVTSQPLTNLYMSDSAATIESELKSGEQTYTYAPQALSTRPVLKTIFITEDTNMSSDVHYFQTDYKMPSDITSQPLTNLHMSDTAATSESEFNLDEQTYTAAPQAPSTWSALKTILTTEENNASSDVHYFHTDYKMPSTVSSQPLTNLHMSDTAATIESELNLDEQTYTAAAQDPSTWSALKTILTTENNASSDVHYFHTDYKMPSTVSSQPLTNLHMFDIAATTEHELNSGEQMYTSAPQIPSTWSALKESGTTVDTIVSTDVKSFQTDYKMPSNVTTQPLTSLQNLDIAATIEQSIDLFMDEQTYTAAPQTLSTRSALKTIVTTEETNASSDVHYFPTDYKMPSNVTSQPYRSKANRTGILPATDATITQTPPTSSDTTGFPAVMEMTTYEKDKPGPFASINVTLVLERQSENSLASNTFTNGHYPESDFTSTVNPYPFQNDIFYDALNENGNFIQSTLTMTSTQRSRTSPGAVRKSTTYIKPHWNSKAPHFNSTASADPSWNSSKRSPYSTIVPKSFSITKDHTTHFSFPSSLNVSLSDRAGQKSLHSTLIPAVIQRTPFTKSKAALETYSPSMTTHQFNTTLSSTRKHMLIQQATVSPSQEDHHLSNQTPKLGTVTGTSSYLTSKSVTESSTSSMKSAFNLLVSTISTSSRLLVSTPFQLRNGTTVTHTSASFKSENTFKTPALRLRLPQSRTTLPPNTTSSVYSTKYILTHMVGTTPSLPLISPSVVKMPMSFHLMGIVYSKQLSDPTTDEYQTLESEIKLVLNKIFSSYYLQEYVQTEILEFLNGSVIVKNNVVFDSHFPTPSCSDIVRTVLSAIYGTNSYFGWNINGSTVECQGYTQNNLEIESLPISFLVLHVGYIAVSQNSQDKQSFLDYLQKQVFQAVNVSFPITNVSFSQIRDVYGDLEVRGFLYLNSPVHINVQSLLSTLLPLVNRSVDFSSVTVAGVKLSELKVHSILFRVINQPFVVNLLDMSSPESQILSKDLSMVVQSVLRDTKPLQVIMREFKSGSVVCRGDVLYQLPAPGSKEVLQLLLNSLGSDGILGSSSYKVDFKTVTVGDSSPGPFNEYVNFPGFGVAIIVMCGLLILIFPALVYMFYKTRVLGHRKKATIQQRHDPDNQSHHFEMDNRAFRASIEQGILLVKMYFELESLRFDDHCIKDLLCVPSSHQQLPAAVSTNSRRREYLH